MSWPSENRGPDRVLADRLDFGDGDVALARPAASPARGRGRAPRPTANSRAGTRTAACRSGRPRTRARARGSGCAGRCWWGSRRYSATEWASATGVTTCWRLSRAHGVRVRVADYSALSPKARISGRQYRVSDAMIDLSSSEVCPWARGRRVAAWLLVRLVNGLRCNPRPARHGWRRAFRRAHRARASRPRPSMDTPARRRSRCPGARRSVVPPTWRGCGSCPRLELDEVRERIDPRRETSAHEIACQRRDAHVGHCSMRVPVSRANAVTRKWPAVATPSVPTFVCAGCAFIHATNSRRCAQDGRRRPPARIGTP